MMDTAGKAPAGPNIDRYVPISSFIKTQQESKIKIEVKIEVKIEIKIKIKIKIKVKIKIKDKDKRKRRFYWKANRSFSALRFVKDDRSIPEYLNPESLRFRDFASSALISTSTFSCLDFERRSIKCGRLTLRRVWGQAGLGRPAGLITR